MQLLHLVRIYRRLASRRFARPSLVFGIMAVAILGNAICFQVFEGPVREDPLSFGDAIWYSIISITTIGYGDFFPTTAGARIATVVFIVVIGLGAFSMIVGMTIDTLTEFAARRRRGMANILANDHIVIVNAPTTERLAQLVTELKADTSHEATDIVVISDRIDELPFQDSQVLFVRGSVLDRATYLRACVEQASKAIVLATSYDDPGSDAVVASAVAVIDSIKPDIHIVAECINPSHRPLFDTVHCDSIVFSMGITGNLLAQEAQDPGGRPVDRGDHQQLEGHDAVQHRRTRRVRHQLYRPGHTAAGPGHQRHVCQSRTQQPDLVDRLPATTRRPVDLRLRKATLLARTPVPGCPIGH